MQTKILSAAEESYFRAVKAVESGKKDIFNNKYVSPIISHVKKFDKATDKYPIPRFIKKYWQPLFVAEFAREYYIGDGPMLNDKLKENR